MTQKLEKIVIGHNSFFGIDHLSLEKGRQRQSYFSNIPKILDIVDFAFDHGARGIMMSTHERAQPVAELIRQNTRLKNELTIYPLLPYVQKYVQMANQKGMMNVIMESLSGGSFTEKISMIWDGTKTVFAKDIYGMLKNLIRIELQTFRDLKMGCVFLHDIFTDIMLALDLKDIATFYHEEIPKYGNAAPGFATKNLPLLLVKFEAWGFKNPYVLTHFNKIGFSMNPSREACENILKTHPCELMAMSTLASGYIHPEEAFSYLGTIEGVDSIVVGASTKNHVIETFQSLKKYFIK